MGFQVAKFPQEHYESYAGTPPAAQRMIDRGRRVHQGWASKPPTNDMREFHEKLLWAARARKWTSGGMAVRHLMHYLENTGRDYAADMDEMLKNPVIAETRDEMIEIARLNVFELNLRPGTRFRSRRVQQVIPKNSGQGRVPTSHYRDAWYSVGTFAAWLEASVAPGALVVEFHMIDFYDWDQTTFTVPIPQKTCKRLENPILKWVLGSAIDKMTQDPRVQRTGCSITADDTVMGDLHSMGLAKNYVTRGVHKERLTL